MSFPRLTRAFWKRAFGICLTLFVAALPAMAEGKKKTPENPSIILILGGGAVLTWKYIRARLGR